MLTCCIKLSSSGLSITKLPIYPITKSPTPPPMASTRIPKHLASVIPGKSASSRVSIASNQAQIASNPPPSAWFAMTPSVLGFLLANCQLLAAICFIILPFVRLFSTTKEEKRYTIPWVTIPWPRGGSMPGNLYFDVLDPDRTAMHRGEEGIQRANTSANSCPSR
jgi:hypothetical protein